MKVGEHIKCLSFLCHDINKAAYLVPYKEIDPPAIQIVMISEVPPIDENDYYYAQDNPFYLQTTVQAFDDAGIGVATMQQILDLGVYLTTAVKCGKTQYSISTSTIKNCSEILEKEIALFPNIKAFLLLGDVAIKSMNYVWKRQTGTTVIPGDATYKIRKQQFFFQEKRVFPSYLQTGKAYFIEKSKRRMIAEDIKEAIGLIKC